MNRKASFFTISTALVLPALGVLLARAWAARQLRQDARRLFAQVPDREPAVYHETQLRGLPAPVQRYFRRVLREGQPYLRHLRLRHTGQFKTDLRQDWTDITGTQYVTAEPPAFIWQGRTRLFTARDEYVNGHGRLTVRLLGALPVVQGQGPSYDQGELLRWLGESTWLPTSLLPGEHLRWTAIDEHSARVTLTHGEQTVTYLMRFNEQDEITECETHRYQDGHTLLPWVGRATHYRRLHGVRVPTVLEGNWVVDGQRQPYARFTVQELDYDQPRPW